MIELYLTIGILLAIINLLIVFSKGFDTFGESKGWVVETHWKVLYVLAWPLTWPLMFLLFILQRGKE